MRIHADPDPQPCFKLPDFGTTSPTAWFGVTEAQFLLRDSETQRDCYSLVTTVLSGASACSVAQILACPGTTAMTTFEPPAWWLNRSPPSRRPKNSSPLSP